MQSNAGMANRQGDGDLRFAQVSVVQLTLWLGLAPGILLGLLDPLRWDQYVVPKRRQLPIYAASNPRKPTISTFS
jgi:hypothetical protein